MKTHQFNRQPEHVTKQGSTLTVVLIIMMLTSFMAASLLTLGSHEKDFTYRRIADVEGRHVLESAVEIAMAELQQHFRQAQSVTNTIPSITLPTPLVTQLVGNTRYVDNVRITNITNTQFKRPIFVDADDPDTVLDPHRGSFVRVSEWTIQAEADVNYRGQTRQMRAAQSFQVRESPFFTHAILYNMDLEFHPGPAMLINGPVHSNGRIWAVAINSLHFLDRVSATEGIHIGGMMEGNQEDWGSGYLSRQSGANVWFNTNGREPDKAKTNEAHNRTFANLWDGNGGREKKAEGYFDARSEASGKLFSELDFSSMSEFLANWFDGNVAMGSHDAPIIRSQFIPNYVADDGNGNRLNHGYALIEPLMRKLDHNGDPNPYHKGMGEEEKFAFKSGMTFEIKYLPDFHRSELTADQAHWRQLWEEGRTPVQPPVFWETFNQFDEGNLDGQNGFSVTGTNKSDVEISSHPHLPEYTEAYFEHNHSKQFIELKPGGNQDSGYVHTLIPTLTDDIYISFLLDAQNANPNTEFELGLTNTDTFTSIPGFSIIASPSGGQNIEITSQIGSNLLSGSRETSSEFTTTKNQTFLIVMKASQTADRYGEISLYINPTSLTEPDGTEWKTATYDTGLEELNRLFLRAKGNSFRVTDIRIGTEYRQVVGKQEGATDYWLIPQKVKRTNARDMDTTDSSVFEGLTTLPDYDEEAATSLLVEHDPVYIQEWPTEDDSFSFHDVFRARLYSEVTSGSNRRRPVPNGGLYDQRDLKPQDLVSINMRRFKEDIVETTALDRFRKPLNDGSTVLTYNPANEFNGVVYVQFPLPGNREAAGDEDPANFLHGNSRPDNIIIARDNFRFIEDNDLNDYTSLSLFIHNANQIPNPDYNKSYEPGFTLATNARLYLHGSYNADGISSTGSFTEGDGKAEFDALAAVAADTVTFLSSDFRVENSKDRTRIKARFTEINAAVMSGILATNSNDIDLTRYTPRNDYPISGGSHNYHRFLEDFGGVTFRYRGSMVAFYESELSRSPQEQRNNTWYNAPRREYGFYEVFETGAQPPGTPMARTFFKMDFRFE